MTNPLANIPARVVELADKAAMTAAEGALLAVGGDQVFNAFDADWSLVGGMALGGAFLSVALNVARSGITGRAKKA